METQNLLHDGASAPKPDYETNVKEQNGGSGRSSTVASQEDAEDRDMVTVTRNRFCPLSPCQVAVVVLASLAAVLAVAMVAGGYHALVSCALRQELVIKEGSKAYDMWKSTAVPLTLRLHIFNLTNPDEVKKGGKPVVEEVGPYVWREYHEKHNVTFHENNTVTYFQQRWWEWDEEASGNRSQDDTIITLNTVPVAAAYSVRGSSVLNSIALDYAFRKVGERLTVAATARQLVFDGVQDPLLDWIQKNVVAKTGSYHFLLPFLQRNGGALAEFEKFAWFFKRNMSLTYDGMFNMMTGEDTLENLGKIDNWNGRNDTSFYTPPCNQVTGSAGELFPPHISQEDLVIFSSDLCMSAKLFFKNVENHDGLDTYRFWGTNHTFANGSTVPGNECYCVKDTCAPMGLLNAESCRMGAPAFISFPHFYAADPFLLDSVDGLAPDEEKHAFFLDVVPDIGVPAAVSVKLQINLHLRPNTLIGLFRSVPQLYMPMLWFEVRAEMTPSMTTQVKGLTFLLYSPVANVVLWVLMLVAAVVTVLAVLLYNWRTRNGGYHGLVSSE